jgi:hypothetical protein
LTGDGRGAYVAARASVQTKSVLASWTVLTVASVALSGCSTTGATADDAGQPDTLAGGSDGGAGEAAWHDAKPEPDAPIEVSDGARDATSSSDSAPPEDSGASVSHRPPGLATIFDYDFSAPLPTVAGGGTSGLVTTPPVYYMADKTAEPSRYPGAWTPLVDPTAPAGSSSVLEISWPAGLWANGSAQEPGVVALGTSGSTTYTKFYLGIWSKLISTTGAGGTGFELTYNGPGIKFLGYVSVGDPQNPPRGLYFLLNDPAAPNGVSSGPFALQLAAQIGNAISYNLGQGYGGPDASASASKAPLIPIDKWVLYEFYFQLDTLTAGHSNSDGWFQGWIDGTLAFDYRDVQYRNATYTAGFYQWDGDFVWGGQSASAKVRTDYQAFARAIGAGQ